MDECFRSLSEWVNISAEVRLTSISSFCLTIVDQIQHNELFQHTGDSNFWLNTARADLCHLIFLLYNSLQLRC